MEINKETGKIIVAADEATSVPNIFAIGDIAEVGVMDECQGNRTRLRRHSWKATNPWLIGNTCSKYISATPLLHILLRV